MDSKTPDNPIDLAIDIARGVAEYDPKQFEHRSTRRMPFTARVALVQRVPDGGKSIPTVVDGKDISPGGMCVTARNMLHVGHEGACLVQRSNGEKVVLGMRVVHCRYAGQHTHECGLKFIPVPDGFTMDDFVDQQGNMPSLTMPGKAA